MISFFIKQLPVLKINNFKILFQITLKPGQACPETYQVLENTLIAVPTTFLSDFILSTKKEESKSSRVKRLLSAFFEPKDMFEMNTSKMTARYPKLMKKFDVSTAINKVIPGEFLKVLLSSLGSLRGWGHDRIYDQIPLKI